MQPLSPTEQVLTETQPPKRSSFWQKASTVLVFAASLFGAILLNLFVFQSYLVDGSSMEPTLQNNDRLIIYKAPITWGKIRRQPFVPQRGDVIVFHKPNGTSDQLIKRVIGLPGERVVVKNEKITVFNSTNPDGFSPDEAPYGASLAPTFGNVDITVGQNEVFVCGDNRIAGASLDSRSSLGNVPLDKIVGKLVLRYVPVGDVKTF
jgi:signal peptidase I